MNLQLAKNIMAKATTIIELMNELYEVEDEYLECWLMNGCPDGASLSEIIDYVEDTELYLEWVDLANRLLEARADQEDEEEDY